MKKLIPLIFTLALISPLNAQFFGQKKKADLMEAINNAKQIGIALFEFDTDYGAFPSEQTKATVEENAGVTLPEDDKSSDSLFRQIFAAGITESERIFYANIPGAKRGDQAEALKALGKGKNAFTYIAGLNSAGNIARPIVLCPVIPGTTKFDPKPFGGKALLLRIDQSVEVYEIEDDGTVLIAGKDILSKEHPLWDGKQPDIRYPDIPKDAK